MNDGRVWMNYVESGLDKQNHLRCGLFGFGWAGILSLILCQPKAPAFAFLLLLRLP